MRTPQEAVSIILDRTRPSALFESCSLSDAAGRVLAKSVQSDLDLPPFQKSAMDGYAVRSADFSGGAARLKVLGEARAGVPFEGEIPPGHCVAIYTGGQVPEDCDAVVMVEKSEVQGDFVQLTDSPGEGQHICNRGEDLSMGQEVLAAGTRLQPAMVSLLASVGCVPVPVVARPRIAILTTGDELIDPTDYPGPGQIREGNTLHLAALARAAGADVIRSGVVRDDLAGLTDTFRSALEACDILVTTGGVSMGKYDLVGEALEAVGVEKVFHKVAIKPGKPVWFGTFGDKLVFGLPGNPVSCWVGHDVFVNPAIAKFSGLPESEWVQPLRVGRWNGNPTRENNREQHLPAIAVQGADGVDELDLVRWKSSADLVGLSKARVLAVVPPNVVVRQGDRVLYRSIV